MPNPFYNAAHQRGNVRAAYQQKDFMPNVLPLPFDIGTQMGKHRFWNQHTYLNAIDTLQSSSAHNDYTQYPPTGQSAFNCTDENGHWMVCGSNGGVIEPIPILPLPRVIRGELGPPNFKGITR